MACTNCSECPLNAHKGNKVRAFKGRSFVGDCTYAEVPYRGPKNAQIVIVGESPGSLEIYKGQPFVGETGELVDKALRENGLDPSKIFFANACRCMLGKEDKTNKKVLKASMSACRPALEKLLKILKPKVILCFGDVAMAQVLKQTGITKKRGRFHRSEEFDCWVFPTFHPAACFRDQGKFAFWNPDMATFARFVKNGFEMKEDNKGVYQDTDSIRFLLDKKNITAAFDTETQGADWCDPNSVVISYSVSDQEGTGYNVWLCSECEEKEADLTIHWPRKGSGRKVEDSLIYVKKAPEYERRIDELRELCIRDDIKLVMMNGNYDLHRLRQLGIERTDVHRYTFDIQLAAHALDPDNFVKASMLSIQQAFLSEKTDHKTAFGEEVDKSDMLKAAKENPERHMLYAAADTDVTLCLSHVLKDRMVQDKLLTNYYAKLAHPVQSIVLYELEKNGITFNLEKLPETKEEVAKVLREKEEAFLALVPQKVREKHESLGLKLTLSAFIRDVFFNKKLGFGLPVLAKTPSGDPTTDRKVLVRVRDDLDDCDAKEALNLLIEWGPYQKLYSTYLKGFENAVKPDGKLHTQISKCGTATGRTSSSNPNL